MTRRIVDLEAQPPCVLGLTWDCLQIDAPLETNAEYHAGIHLAPLMAQDRKPFASHKSPSERHLCSTSKTSTMWLREVIEAQPTNSLALALCALAACELRDSDYTTLQNMCQLSAKQTVFPVLIRWSEQ